MSIGNFLVTAIKGAALIFLTPFLSMFLMKLLTGHSGESCSMLFAFLPLVTMAFGAMLTEGVGIVKFIFYLLTFFLWSKEKMASVDRDLEGLTWKYGVAAFIFTIAVYLLVGFFFGRHYNEIIRQLIVFGVVGFAWGLFQYIFIYQRGFFASDN